MAEKQPVGPRGKRKVAGSPTVRALVDILVANTSYTAHILSTLCTGKIVKIHWSNQTGGPGYLRFGETIAAAFVRRIPDIYMVNGMPDWMRQDEIVGFIFTTNIIVQATVGGATPTCHVAIEVEEYGA